VEVASVPISFPEVEVAVEVELAALICVVANKPNAKTQTNKPIINLMFVDLMIGFIA
jgi:hypothetical protein